MVSFAFALGLAAFSPAVDNQNLFDTSAAPRATPQPVRQLSPEQRGDILMATKHYREAVDTYHEGPASSAVLHNKIGIAYHQLLNISSAKKEYETAIKLDRDYSEAVNNLGTVYYSQKSYRHCIRLYKQALKIAPSSASIYSNLGTAYFSRKDYKNATINYQRALELDPEVFERHSHFGSLLQERTVTERAKFHYYMAKSYAQAGQRDRALLYIRKALEEGFTERKKFMEDSEFTSLRELPEFKQLIASEPRVL